MEVGFVILCPNCSLGGLRNTLGSINHHSYNRPSICMLPGETEAKEVKEFKEHCSVHKGESTFTSLINAGLKKIKTDWACVVIGGCRIQPLLEKKWQSFVSSDKDILFPVVDRKNNFVDGSFNGVLIHTKTFKAIGDFPDLEMRKIGLNDFELAKMFWALDAMDYGCTFKAIVGMRFI